MVFETELTLKFDHPLLGVRLVESQPPVEGTRPSRRSRTGTVEVIETSLVPPVDAAELETRMAQQWAEIEEVFASIQESIQELEQRRNQSLKELQDLSIELAAAIASHVLQAKIEANEVQVAPIIATMIERFQKDEQLTITLNPVDLQLLECQASGQPPAWLKMDRVELVSDPTVARASCRIEGESFDLVRCVENELSVIQQQLTEELEHAETERRETHSAGQGIRRYPDRRETA